jgi:hypothetical protein
MQRRLSSFQGVAQALCPQPEPRKHIECGERIGKTGL